jgi:hypothetical protein
MYDGGCSEHKEILRAAATRGQLRSDGGITNPPCTLRVVDRFTVNAEGKMTQQENHYDPRPALPASA